ncbi:hypothetical protein [Faunimonas pinastri]|uniref:hypothetical protein n=1 Tax=Faunimonas pinastri TaxID=1855383 RepID=UPI00115FA845|nr:hypothetical protein [Faunimonas pinastri]
MRITEEEAALIAFVPALASVTERYKATASEAAAAESEIAIARERYADDDLEIDDDPIVSNAENGVWVSAWVWVPSETFVCECCNGEWTLDERADSGLCKECERTQAAEEENEDLCRTCGAQYEDGGDGFDGECPSCADKTDQKLHPENYEDQE